MIRFSSGTITRSQVLEAWGRWYVRISEGEGHAAAITSLRGSQDAAKERLAAHSRAKSFVIARQLGITVGVIQQVLWTHGPRNTTGRGLTQSVEAGKIERVGGGDAPRNGVQRVPFKRNPLLQEEHG